MIKEMNSFKSTPRNIIIGSWKLWFEHNEVDFNAWYQRDYVWTHKEQTEYLNNLFSKFPCGHISIFTHDDVKMFVEVVDGKQRLTTLKLFLDNEIQFNSVFYKDLSSVDKRYINNLSIPVHDLETNNEIDKLNLFYNINFSGVPQNEDHKTFIINKINELSR